MTKIATVTVLGTGVLGSQIAYQSAYSGYPVVAYDISDEILAEAKTRFRGLARTYRSQVVGAADGKADEALSRISFSSNIADAVKGADLVIEAVPEQIDIKRAVYHSLSEVAPVGAIFATNSSTLLPSSLMELTGRPERFLAMHFANKIWQYNTAEVMGTTKTNPSVYQSVVEFAGSIGMVPIEIHKENAGYLLNSLLVPFLSAAGDLLVDGIADPDTIDKTWRIGTGAPTGTFQIYDAIGLTTAYNISSAGAPNERAFADYLKKNYIDKGKLGVSTGEGFYKYPHE